MSNIYNKTFTQDNIVFFDRSEANLKGCNYRIDKEKQVIVIDPNSIHLLDKQLPSYIFSYWIYDENLNVCLNKYDLEDCIENPFELEIA